MSTRDMKKGMESVELVQAKVLSPSFIHGGRILEVGTPVVALPRDVVARHALKQGGVVVSARGDFVAGLVDVDPSELTGGLPLLAGPLCHTLSFEHKGSISTHELLPGFINWLLGTDYAMNHMAASSRGAAISLYSLETIGSLSVPILSIEKQQAIVEAALAARSLREARLVLAEAELESNNKDLSRMAGIIS